MIPPYSVDINFFELLGCLLDFRSSIDKKLNSKFEKIFPGKYFKILPQSRQGMYACLKSKFKKGDTIFISALSYPLYVDYCNELGLNTVIIDVTKNDLNMSIEKVKEAINSKRPNGIIFTLLFGRNNGAHEISKLCKKEGIYLIEDSAQAFLTEGAGSYGDIAFFSFSSTKSPTSFGGGLVVSNQPIPIDWNQAQNNHIKSLKIIILYLASTRLICKYFSHHMLCAIKKFNPNFYSKIFDADLYGESSLSKTEKQLNKFQKSILLQQLNKSESMKNKRRSHYQIIKNKSKNKNLYTLEQSNYQACIIKHNNVNELILDFQRKKIYLINEEIFNLSSKEHDEAYALKNNILRIPNRSCLKESEVNVVLDELNLVL